MMIWQTKLKNIFLVDAACIAMGFILRILSGCFAIFVLPSPLVILMTFFMSMFFTFTKRKLELKMLCNNSDRVSLKGLNEKEINKFVIINAVFLFTKFALYVSRVILSKFILFYSIFDFAKIHFFFKINTFL